MLKFFLLPLVFPLASCATAKKVITPTPPTGYRQIVLDSLDNPQGYCYTTSLGTGVYTDGTVPCPPKKEVDFVQGDVNRQWDALLPAGAWEWISIHYTAKVINCGGQGAMGCTSPEAPDAGLVVISLYYPWRRATLRHEFTHWVYFSTGQSEMKHFCLDNPAFCAEFEVE